MPAAIASCGEIDLYGSAVNQNFARVRPVKSVNDIHGGGFSRAIFADQPVHRACRHRKGDRTIGVHRAKAFVDAAQFECRDLRRRGNGFSGHE